MRSRITVQCDGPRRRSLHLDRLAKERLGRGDIAPGAEPKVYGLSVAIYRPVQIDPLAADLHVGLVDAPRRPYRPRELVPATLEFRNIGKRLVRLVCVTGLTRAFAVFTHR